MGVGGKNCYTTFWSKKNSCYDRNSLTKLKKNNNDSTYKEHGRPFLEEGGGSKTIILKFEQFFSEILRRKAFLWGGEDF